MNNFVKRIWFGALLRPQCWICAAVNHQIVGGAIAVLLFLLTGWFATAGFVALFVFLFMVHLIIFPERPILCRWRTKRSLLQFMLPTLPDGTGKTANANASSSELSHATPTVFAKRYGRTAKCSDMTTACAATAFFWLSLIPLHGPLSATDLKTGVFWDGNSAIMFLPNG